MSDGATHYRVLARKYRPRTLAELVGQDALVRTVTNAFKSGRIAHAFLFTGVRGVGKTSTARIIARGLNCLGADGKGGPTPEPCGVCEPCIAIGEDRHVDVIEMDAASHTGVADMRELIDGVRYKPAVARYKVYIIDEVHMLSSSAFNALLKTLEEPPPHVVFLFATTEVRKLPVTVLSRCQRFDLRRVEAATLIDHFSRIVKAENVTIEPGALALIARAADGSVRDGLSLLDQAIAHGGGTIDEQTVRDMLGLADRAQVIELFEHLIRGDAAGALGNLEHQYSAGADPAVVLADLLEFTHWLTRLKVLPSAADEPTAPEAERAKGRALAAKLTMPVLSRAWQILFKGLGDARASSDSLQAVEMALVRLAFAANLPTPAEALAALARDGSGQTSTPSAPQASRQPDARGEAPRLSTNTPSNGRSSSPAGAPRAALRVEPDAAMGPEPIRPRSFADVVALAESKREPILHSLLVHDAHLVHFEPGKIELRLSPAATQKLPTLLSKTLQEWTGERWVVAVSNEEGEPTLAQQSDAERLRALEQAAQHPVVKAALDMFPGARISGSKRRAPTPEAESNAEPHDSDELDEEP